VTPEQLTGIARVGGLVAWASVSTSVLIGLLLATRLIRSSDRWGEDLHRFVSAFAVAATALHLIGVVFGTWADLSTVTALWWLFAPSRPTGFNWGVPALHLLMAVTMSSLFRDRLTMPVWRVVHRAAGVMFVLITVHLFTAGNGSVAVQWAAFVVTAIAVFLFTYRLTMPATDRPGERAETTGVPSSVEDLPTTERDLVPFTPPDGWSGPVVPVEMPTEVVAAPPRSRPPAAPLTPPGAPVETRRSGGGTYRDPTVVISANSLSDLDLDDAGEVTRVFPSVTERTVVVEPVGREELTDVVSTSTLAAERETATRDRNSPRSSADDGLEIELVVRSVGLVAEDVLGVRLADPDGENPPAWTPGAHIRLELPSGQVRAFPLCGDLADRDCYRIAVHRDTEDGTDLLRTGLLLRASLPRNDFPLRPAGSYLFVAEGIGIATVLPLVRQAAADSTSWRLLYSGPTRRSMAFAREILTIDPRKVRLVPENTQGRPDLSEAVTDCRMDTHVYASGSRRLIEELRLVIPGDRLHFGGTRDPDPAAVG
jgi:ferredoxin-NADP reductase